MLRTCFRDSDLLARLEGGTFAVLAADAGPDTTALITSRIGRHVAEYNGMTLRAYTLALTVGCAPADAAEGAPIENLLKRAAEGRRPPPPGDAGGERPQAAAVVVLLVGRRRATRGRARRLHRGAQAGPRLRRPKP
jgi:hypothetical protein